MIRPPTQPSRAMVQWSVDGNTFQDMTEDEFLAGVSQGLHTTKPVIPLPEQARYARIAFTPQVGGDESIIEAYLISGAPSIGKIFQNLVLMLFTSNLLGSMVEIKLLPLIVEDVHSESLS